MDYVEITKARFEDAVLYHAKTTDEYRKNIWYGKALALEHLLKAFGVPEKEIRKIANKACKAVVLISTLA